MREDLIILALYGHQECRSCHTTKLICKFSAYQGMLANVCNTCRAARPTSKIAQENKRIIEKARNVPCKDCGNHFPPVCMDFDHLPTHKKSFNISTALSRPTQALLSELAKCEVVCSNCHRIRTLARHADKRTPKPPQTHLLHLPKASLQHLASFVKTHPKTPDKALAWIDSSGMEYYPSVRRAQLLRSKGLRELPHPVIEIKLTEMGMLNINTLQS